MEEFEVLELSNGLRAVHKNIPSAKVVHCGFVLNLGSRDEGLNEYGLAHFWEHMAFKGTTTRKAFHVLNRLESVGGELNAYTSKEKVYFYASVLNEHFERAIELLTDITFNSVFPKQEIEKEKSVIVEEIAMYEDSPEELIFDEFENTLFDQHPLGKFILGTRESVNSFKKESFSGFLEENLNTNRIVFSAVGGVEPDRFEKLVLKYLSEIHTKNKVRQRFDLVSKGAVLLEKKVSSQQAHCMIGGIAPSLHSDDRLACSMVSNLLGGPAMTSRLNMSLREKRGLVYNIESSYVPYYDLGAFSIYFGTDPSNVKRAKRLVSIELNRLKNDKIGENQLNALKRQFVGQIAMAEESNSAVMQMMARSLLDFNRIESFEEVIDRIQTITSQELLDVSTELFDEDKFTILKYLPES